MNGLCVSLQCPVNSHCNQAKHKLRNKLIFKSASSSITPVRKMSCGYKINRKVEYVQRHVRFVNAQSSLHENVVFSVCACVGNAVYIIFIMWNSISGLDTCYHFRLSISCGVAVTVRSHKKKYQVTLGRGGGGNVFDGRANF